MFLEALTDTSSVNIAGDTVRKYVNKATKTRLSTTASPILNVFH